jgi:uncharacterized protein YutE (UPF0331/DUF86 family)
MNIDEERVVTLVLHIRQALEALYELKKIPLESFLEDPYKKSGAKYNFIIAIEAAVDLCNHAISRRRLRVPPDYADSFRVLAEAGAFEPSF